ncbi:prepilin peptidase [Fervidobacterium thailandense]|uniref:Peptidase A24 n=1 Tax=Fervidobacterium thailandense TaxID=1008305 RepID=A0A1E3G4B8_9BACT|nr:A24 family peptidase [Fervidobacterium thailandense]ODN31131.1 peptidase A24 [Fervidobacterium thailandense]
MWDFVKYFTVFVLGLIFGSFSNVLIYRPVAGLRLNEPRFSICPHCKARIKWYDNIPLVSYILLRGRCRNCGERISLRYPLVELLHGVVFLLNVIFFPLEIAFALNALFLVSFSAAVVDFKILMLPDYTWIVTLIVATYINLTRFRSQLILDLSAGVVVLLLLLLLKLRYKDGLGEGDIFLFPVYAFACGFLYMPLLLLLSSSLGIIFGYVKKIKVIPFGPFIVSVGYVLVLIRYAQSVL